MTQEDLIAQLFRPAYYSGEGRDSNWHLTDSCTRLTAARNRGNIRKTRIGAMFASGKKPCTQCCPPDTQETKP